MVNYTCKQICELKEKWSDYMRDSWERGNKNIDFVIKSRQYAKNITFNGPEQFVFNMSLKMLTTAKSNGKDIELALKLYSKGYDESKEKQAFKCLVNQLMTTGSNRKQAAASLDKVYDFGQSVFHVKAKAEDERTLNKILELECLRDPTTAFFDPHAQSSTFMDGNYCGRTYCIKGVALKKLYKNKLTELSDKKEYEVIDFWYFKTKGVKYLHLSSGEYIREDIYKLNKGLYSLDKSKPDRKGEHRHLVKLRVIDGHEKILDKTEYADISVLPMVMDGSFVWTGKDVLESFPFGWHLKDAQKLMNYAASTIAELVKATKFDKYLFEKEHLKTEESRRSAQQITERGGSMKFDGDVAKIRREIAQQIPQGLMSFFGELPGVIQNLAGSFMDGNADQIKAISGVALDKMFNRADLVQNPVIVAHINALNSVGYVIQQMIPTYYHENRTLYVKKEDGSMDSIEINKQVDGGQYGTIIENDVRKLKNHYDYNVSVGAARRLQKQNLQAELHTLYSMYPQAIASTIDLYVNSLDVPETDVLARRLGVNIPRELIQYGNSEINYSQYEEYEQKEQQQAAQAQASNPQAQYLQAKAQGEISRAQVAHSNATTAAYKAKSEHMQAVEEAKNTHIKNVSGAVKVQFDQENAKAERELQLIKAHLQQIDDIINAESGK